MSKVQAAKPMAPLTLDSSSAIKLTMGTQMAKERALMARNDVWHRIMIVRGARYDKEMILRTILSAVEPYNLIPVRYQVSGDDAYFMVRNCSNPLEMLCRSNLIINLPNGDPIVIIVTLGFASIHDLKINIQPILLAALTRRYDPNLKYLNLENFHRDAEIAKTVYCPLLEAKTLSHTLKLAKTTLAPFKYLNLQRNDLTSLVALENSNLASLRVLDLRHNNILTMSALGALKNLTIEQMWLDGNPLCENYGSPKRYVESAKLYCPRLIMLDGVDLRESELPISRDYYYVEENDSRKIVQQFIAHFFDIYDNGDRSSLSSVYRKNSLFSLTLGACPDSQNRQNCNDAFSKENRNILGTADSKKIRKLIRRGPEEIITVLNRLPATFHDRRNFRYDIMWESHRRMLVNVEGIFKTTSPPKLYSFCRTFMLVGGDENEYNVLNDQYHVLAAHPIAMFFHNIDESMRNENKFDAKTILTPREKEGMIYTLMDVTTMNTEWCHRFLDNANWNSRKAIKLFMEYYKDKRIPVEAFGK